MATVTGLICFSINVLVMMPSLPLHHTASDEYLTLAGPRNGHHRQLVNDRNMEDLDTVT